MMENLSTGYTWDEAPHHLKQAALHLSYALKIDKIEAYQLLLEKIDFKDLKNALSTTEKKGSWTIEGVMAEYDETGKLSRRKKAFMKEVYLTAVKEKQIEFDREFYNYLGDIR